MLRTVVPPLANCEPNVDHPMSSRFLVTFALAIFGMILMPVDLSAQERAPVYWDVHDPERPNPPVVDPGPAPSELVAPPADAVVLFGGDDLSAWTHPDGSAAKWGVRDDVMEVVPGTGDIQTKQSFGDVQLHIEWAAPSEMEAHGNSGVFLMNRYEVQVLDSYESQHADGQAAALYGQYPPLVIANRPPGEWQTYDIIFRRPHFDANGNVVRRARVTVFHNGILVQDDEKLTGPTTHGDRPPYEEHPNRLPIRLQDHGDSVQFRNIWVRELDRDDDT